MRKVDQQDHRPAAGRKDQDAVAIQGGEISGLGDAGRFAAGMSAAFAGQTVTTGQFVEVLRAEGVSGPVIVAAEAAQQASDSAAAAWARAQAELAGHRQVGEAYAANPGAGTKGFVTADAAPSDATLAPASGGDDVPSLGSRPAGQTPPDGAPSDEIPPQWPGHVPRRRWEWMVRAHRPGTPHNLKDALPAVDLASEQALRTYLQDAFQRYDKVELHHWYSGSELTFTRQPDGSVDVARRQLRPTDGAPGNRQ
jgi:hypothetical protein